MRSPVAVIYRRSTASPSPSTQSVQVIGPRYREDLCLDAAAALEGKVGIITPIDPG